MSDTATAYANARNLAVDILRAEKNRTPEMIGEVATKAAQAATIFAPTILIDVEILTAELLHLFSVRAGEVTILDDHDPKGHVPWLLSKRAEIKWRFWSRYVTYLERDFGMPPEVVNNLHELTDKILERLEEQYAVDPDVTVEEVECLAACGGAPSMQVNYEFHEKLTPESAQGLVEEYRSGSRAARTISGSIA